jgi:hypothetical protein
LECGGSTPLFPLLSLKRCQASALQNKLATKLHSNPDEHQEEKRRQEQVLSPSLSHIELSLDLFSLDLVYGRGALALVRVRA